MNKITNKFLLTGDKFMQKLRLKQPGFTYIAVGPFTKRCERIQNFREKGNLKHLYLTIQTISDKTLKHENARNRRYDGYQRASMVYKFFIKKAGLEVSVNEQITEELNKPVTKKFKRRNFCVKFKDNIWAADLAEMESLPSKNKNVKYLLCVIDVFTRYPCFKPLKNKKCKTILNAFIEIVNESNRKTNKLWVDLKFFYNKLIQK